MTLTVDEEPPLTLNVMIPGVPFWGARTVEVEKNIVKEPFELLRLNVELPQLERKTPITRKKPRRKCLRAENKAESPLDGSEASEDPQHITRKRRGSRACAQ